MPKELIDGEGRLAWAASHSAYGAVIETQGPADVEVDGGFVQSDGPRVESPFRLLGQVNDDDAELAWTRFRCFDADTGTWISTDPLEIAGGLNLYGFDGSPSAVVDPLGLATDGKPHGSSSPVHTTTPTDLHAFGNKSAPRPPRIDNPNGKSDLTSKDGVILPTTSAGASTFGDPKQAPVSGHYHTLPAGTKLPDGLGVVADGSDVGGTHAPTHHTIVPTKPMAPSEFQDKFNSLPWQYGGKK